MALDLFQTSDIKHFWSVFGITAVVTYIAAGIGLVAIYRKASMDMLRLVIPNQARLASRHSVWQFNKTIRYRKYQLREYLKQKWDKHGAASNTTSSPTWCTGEELAAPIQSQHQASSDTTSQAEPANLFQQPLDSSASAQSVAQPSRAKSLPTPRRANTSADRLVRAMSSRTT